MVSEIAQPARDRTAKLPVASLAVLSLVLLCSGCITFAGDQLGDIEPEAPQIPPPVIEQTVDGFSFHLDGGKMVSSTKAGREVNKQILNRWKKSGFIASQTYVKSSNFSGKADYNLTLSGHQEGDSSVTMQILSGLTLFLLPYSVNTQFDLVYTVEHVATGRTFEAEAADSFRTVTQLLLFPISPFAMGGLMRTHSRLGDHLFDALAKQGAFDPDSWPELPPDEPASPDDAAAAAESGTESPSIERLRMLEELREEGLVTDEEYDSKKLEILGDL